MLCFADFFTRVVLHAPITFVLAMVNATTDAPTINRVLPNVPTNWEELQLHAWLTVTMLYGNLRPPKRKEHVYSGIGQRRRQVRDMLGLPDGGVLEVVDVLGNPLTIDDGIVVKMMGDSYRGRVPYLRWVPVAPSRAVEVWRQVAHSKATGTEAARDYYLVPIQDDRGFDGYAVIAENARIFNLMLFRSGYADAVLRKGLLLYKSYADGLLCTSGCCRALATGHRELGILRNEIRRLKLRLRDERRARKAAEIEAARIRAAME